MRWIWILAVSVASLTNCLASDGVLEINQTCAEGPGCFPGDDAGFPVRIVNSGSYILTSNLVVPPLVHGMTTESATSEFPNQINLSIDLNGFSISSTTECSGGPLVCSPTSLSDGLGLQLAAIERGSFQVRNGTVEGMAWQGLLCANQCIVQDLNVNNNGHGGMTIDGSVRNSYALRNGGHGIRTGVIGVVENCVSERNQTSGFVGAGTYSNNLSRLNGTYGFDSDGSAVYLNNRSFANDIALRCSGCNAQGNTLHGTTTGIDFENTSSVYGNNYISGGTQDVLNDNNAFQSTPNLCAPSEC